VIYSVVPRELQAELYDRLREHYAGDPGVTVILDRRTGPDRRRSEASGAFSERRELRDRRRQRVTGTFASTDVAQP
jgi:hypothetical protein